jgi:hypothetical protein
MNQNQTKYISIFLRYDFLYAVKRIFCPKSNSKEVIEHKIINCDFSYQILESYLKIIGYKTLSQLKGKQARKVCVGQNKLVISAFTTLVLESHRQCHISLSHL